MKNLLTPLINLVAPPQCLLCSRDTAGEYICERCTHEELTPFDAQRRCLVCFRPLFQRGICELCKREEHPFFQQRMLWDYTPAVKELISEMKFNWNASLCYEIGRMYAPMILEYFLCENWDYIVPIPLHRKRISERGYNQCEHLCAGLTSALYSRKHTRAERTLLKRTRRTEQQALLKCRKQREKNMQGAFSCCVDITAKRILLIDDIYTTGATAREAAHALQLSGATHIDLFTLARSDGW